MKTLQQWVEVNEITLEELVDYTAVLENLLAFWKNQAESALESIEFHRNLSALVVNSTITDASLWQLLRSVYTEE